MIMTDLYWKKGRRIRFYSRYAGKVFTPIDLKEIIKMVSKQT